MITYKPNHKGRYACFFFKKLPLLIYVYADLLFCSNVEFMAVSCRDDFAKIRTKWISYWSTMTYVGI